MTLTLQIAFVAAGFLTWVAVLVVAVILWRTNQGQPVRELPAHVAGQAGLLFAGACLVTATVTRGFESVAVLDFLLFAAVFGIAAATITWLAEGPAIRSHPAPRRVLQALALILPLSAGVLAGIVGIP